VGPKARKGLLRGFLSGSLRGATEEELVSWCGPPDVAEGDLRLWRDERTAAGLACDARRWEAQVWLVEGLAASAWLRLVFPDGYEYSEVVW